MDIPMTTLNSAKAKLRRAKSHFQSYERRIKLIQSNNVKHVTSDFDPDTGEKLFLYSRTPRPLSSVGLIIGDAIHNWRSALDHLAWSLVEVNGNTPSRSTAFPIINSSRTSKQSFDNMTRGMSTQTKELVDWYQPIHGKYPNGHWLALLSELDNIDKHRHLYVTLTATNGGSYTGVRLRNMSLPEWVINTGPIEKDTVLARIPKGYGEVDFTPTFSINLAAGLPGQEQPLFSILRGFELITNGIVNDFERKFF